MLPGEDRRIGRINELIFRGEEIAGVPSSSAETGKHPVSASLFTAWLSEVRQFLSEVIGDDAVFIPHLDTLAENLESCTPQSRNVTNGVMLLEFLRTYFAENPEKTEDSAGSSAGPGPGQKYTDGRKIFLVHGHNSFLGYGVEEFLISLKLEPVLLHKPPSHGESFLEETALHTDVRFAVILFTADTIGAEAWLESDDGFADYGLAVSPEYLEEMQVKCREYLEKTDPRPFLLQQNIVEIRDLFRQLKLRAKQNVVFECGYFIGLLGKENVTILCEPSIEIPSDLLGLPFLTTDDDSSWKKELAREIHAAGITIDQKFL